MIRVRSSAARESSSSGPGGNEPGSVDHNACDAAKDALIALQARLLAVLAARNAELEARAADLEERWASSTRPKPRSGRAGPRDEAAPSGWRNSGARWPRPCVPRRGQGRHRGRGRRALRRAADGGRRVGIVMYVPSALAGLACMAATAGDEATAAGAVGEARGALGGRRQAITAAAPLSRPTPPSWFRAPSRCSSSCSTTSAPSDVERGPHPLLAKEPDVLDVLADRARAGVRVRICLRNPSVHVAAENDTGQGSSRAGPAQIREALALFGGLRQFLGADLAAPSCPLQLHLPCRQPAPCHPRTRLRHPQRTRARPLSAVCCDPRHGEHLHRYFRAHLGGCTRGAWSLAWRVTDDPGVIRSAIARGQAV